MKRTTILAEEELLLRLKAQALHEERSLSEIVREALQEYLRTHQKGSKRLSFHAMGASVITDTAERAEELLGQEIKRETGWDADPG